MAFTAIDDSGSYFTVYTWTGDGVNGRALTGVGFQANMMWSKINDGHEHSVIDTVRGVDNRRLKTNTAAAEDEGNTHGHFDSLDSDGFTVTTGGGDYNVNRNTSAYVGWFWKESATAGFDIVAYTGSGSAKTEAHSLSAVPNFMIVKNRDASSDWRIFTDAGGNTKWLQLNDDSALQTASTIWNDTSPTSSVFSVGTSGGVNTDGVAYIAYLFSAKQGFSKFGSYEGNGDADGTFVYTGFRPAWVMCKSIDSTSAWEIFDNKRLGYNVDNNAFVANTSDAQATTDQIDLLSNGFKFKIATDPNVAETYIYAAFAKAPFVNSNGVPCNAR